MDGSRRHFDDIDGCGGPPLGELVPIDGGGAGQGALGRLRPRRALRAVGGDGGSGRRVPRRPAGDRRLLPESVGGGLDRNRRLTTALVVLFAAAAVAFAVVSVVDGDADGDAFASLLPSVLRRLVVPYVLGSVAFHVIGAAGLLLARGGGGGGRGPHPLRPPTSFAGEDLLRGGIAFLLALFASSFATSAARLGGVRWADIPVGLDPLFAVEAMLVVVVAPILQERLFRGLLLVSLRERFGPVLGVLGQAAIAGAALSWQAAPGGRGAVALGAFAVAAVFGWFAHSMDDLRPGMLGHAFLGLWSVLGRLPF